MKKSTRTNESASLQMDIRMQIRLQNDRAKYYCPVCGGNKKLRIATMGSERFDYEKCTACNGTGQRQKPKYTAYELATETWRKEIAAIAAG